MAKSEDFVGHLAQAVELFRDPAAKKAQKQEFRAIVAIVDAEAVAVRVDGARLIVNGTPVSGPAAEGLTRRLADHGVNEIVLPQRTPVSHIFELIKALADSPGGPEDVSARLRGSGAHRPSVTMHRPPELLEMHVGDDALGTGGLLRGEPMAEFQSVPVPGAGGVTHEPTADADADKALPGAGHAEIGASAYDPVAVKPAAEAAPPAAAPPRPVPAAPPPPPPPPLPPQIPLLMVDGAEPEPEPEPPPAPPPPPPAPPPPPLPRPVLEVVPPPPAAPPPVVVPPAPPAPPVPPAPPAPPAPSVPLVGAPRGDAPHFVSGLTPEETPDFDLPADVPSITQDTSATFAPALARSKEATEILGQLAADAQAPHVPDLLAALGRQVEAESRNERWEIVLAIMAGIGRIEQTLPDGSTRRAYGIALKRMATKSVLREIGALALVPMHHADATAALQRAGPDGIDVLMDLLVDSRTVNDRHALFNALAQMKEGSEQLIRLLNDSRWYVVRNAAELIGEMQVDAAVPVLTQLIEHEDERARRAVVLALARIGSAQTVEPLRRALRDRLPGVRLQVAQGIGGRRASPLAMSLVLAMEEEQDPEVERELTLALGRIGSPDAVQALIKLAQPAGRIFGRKPVAKRLAAVDALRLAGTPSAIGTLQGLANDGDKQIKTAAVAALNSLRSREAPSA